MSKSDCVKTGLRCVGFIGLILSLLTGCSSTPSVPDQAVTPQAKPAKPPVNTAKNALKLPQVSPVQRQAVPTTPAVVALIDQAQMAREAGNYESAVATLERALRMQPRNPMLWYRFAEVRLQQDKPQFAVDLALKAKLLAGGDKNMVQQCLALIAHAKGSLGDEAGAAAAEAELQAVANEP